MLSGNFELILKIYNETLTCKIGQHFGVPFFDGYDGNHSDTMSRVCDIIVMLVVPELGLL